MLSISQFAALCGTSVKTIRFYANNNLLPPAYISPINHYRYYEPSSEVIYRKIVFLKDAGFTLNEIRDMLDMPNEALLPKIDSKIQTLAQQTEACQAIKEALRSPEPWMQHKKEVSILPSKTDPLSVELIYDRHAFCLRSNSAQLLAEGAQRIAYTIENTDALIIMSIDDLIQMFHNLTLSSVYTASLTDELVSLPTQILDAKASILMFTLSPELSEEDFFPLLYTAIQPLEEADQDMIVTCNFLPSQPGAEVTILSFT